MAVLVGNLEMLLEPRVVQSLGRLLAITGISLLFLYQIDFNRHMKRAQSIKVI
jgi:hypothetical protein